MDDDFLGEFDYVKNQCQVVRIARDLLFEESIGKRATKELFNIDA